MEKVFHILWNMLIISIKFETVCRIVSFIIRLGEERDSVRQTIKGSAIESHCL